MTQHEERAVWYEPHPVSPERKAEIRSHGFVILDEAFRPEGYTNPEGPQVLSSAAEKPGDDSGEGKVTAAQLREALTARGIAFKANAPKAELQALLDAAERPGD